MTRETKIMWTMFALGGYLAGILNGMFTSWGIPNPMLWITLAYMVVLLFFAYLNAFHDWRKEYGIYIGHECSYKTKHPYQKCWKASGVLHGQEEEA